MNLPKTLPSPAGPWGSPCDLDSRTVSRAGGRDEVAMNAEDLRIVCGEPRTMHRWAGVGQPCLDCGEGFWTTKPCPALIGPGSHEAAPSGILAGPLDDVTVDASQWHHDQAEAVAQEAIRDISQRDLDELRVGEHPDSASGQLYTAATYLLGQRDELAAQVETLQTNFAWEVASGLQRERELADALETLLLAVDPNGPDDGALEPYFYEPCQRAREALRKAGRP